jgi:flagellar protein FlgJ
VTAKEIFGAGFGGLSEKERLRATARELESVVLTQLLSAMRETVPDGGLLEKSATEDLFRSLLDGEIARSAAEKSPFGLADAIVAEYENRFKAADAPTEEPGEAPETGSGVPNGESPSSRSWRI